MRAYQGSASMYPTGFQICYELVVSMCLPFPPFFERKAAIFFPSHHYMLGGGGGQIAFSLVHRSSGW